MTLPSGYPRGRLLKVFTDLGPYIREGKCKERTFFFDCLVVCVNVKLTLESREFWGWWMQLESQQDHFTYEYYFGLFDRTGNWNISVIKGEENNKKIKNNLRNFYIRLKDSLQELKIDLRPAIGFENKTNF